MLKEKLFMESMVTSLPRPEEEGKTPEEIFCDGCPVCGASCRPGEFCGGSFCSHYPPEDD